jgi:hypothetical protein
LERGLGLRLEAFFAEGAVCVEVALEFAADVCEEGSEFQDGGSEVFAFLLMLVGVYEQKMGKAYPVVCRHQNRALEDSEEAHWYPLSLLPSASSQETGRESRDVSTPLQWSQPDPQS